MMKYKSLSPAKQKEVEDFVDFIASRENAKEDFNMKAWQTKIKTLPAWTETDLKVFEENSKAMTHWNPSEW